jgi:predicted DNA-binding transcriptional regulator AlpA
LLLANALRLRQSDTIDVLETSVMFEDDDNTNDDSPFLTIDETAELLRIKRRTLDNLRWSGDGPPARRHGGRVIYHRGEVLDWSERRRTRTPAARGAGKAPPSPKCDPGARRPRHGEPTDRPPAPPVERKP